MHTQWKRVHKQNSLPAANTTAFRVLDSVARFFIFFFFLFHYCILYSCQTIICGAYHLISYVYVVMWYINKSTFTWFLCISEGRTTGIYLNTVARLLFMHGELFIVVKLADGSQRTKTIDSMRKFVALIVGCRLRRWHELTEDMINIGIRIGWRTLKQ